LISKNDEISLFQSFLPDSIFVSKIITNYLSKLMTKTLVLYCTQTGNTREIAKTIFQAIPGYKDLKQFSEISNLDEYDLFFIGFPVYSFGPVRQAKEFIPKYLIGKNIAIFMTMALTAAPTSEQMTELYNLTIKNCTTCAEGSDLLGIFDCPGELSEEAANALLNSEDPLLRMFGAVRNLSIGFPNEKNKTDAEIFANGVFKKYIESKKANIFQL
jgi:flavodoxin I